MAAGNLKHKEVLTMDKDIDKLAHTSWNCKYHIVFAPKYRRQILYKDKKAEIGKILRQLCQWKEANTGSGDLPGPHTYVVKDTAQN